MRCWVLLGSWGNWSLLFEHPGWSIYTSRPSTSFNIVDLKSCFFMLSRITIFRTLVLSKQFYVVVKKLGEIYPRCFELPKFSNNFRSLPPSGSKNRDSTVEVFSGSQRGSLPHYFVFSHHGNFNDHFIKWATYLLYITPRAWHVHSFLYLRKQRF